MKPEKFPFQKGFSLAALLLVAGIVSAQTYIKTLPTPPPPGQTFFPWGATALADGKVLVGVEKGTFPFTREVVKLNQSGDVEGLAIGVSSYTTERNFLFPGSGNEGLYAGMWEGANFFRVRIKTDNSTEWLGLTPTSVTGKVYGSPAGDFYVFRDLNTQVKVIKISNSGTLQWEKVFTYNFTVGAPYQQNLTQTSDGGVLIAFFAYSDSIGLLKLNGSGNQQWFKKIASHTSSDATPLQIGGNYFIGASPKIYKLDLNGNKIATFTVPGFSWLIATADGHLLTGENDVTAGSDLMLKKFTADGTLVWSKTYAKDNLVAFPRILKLMPDGGYLFVGDGRLENNNNQNMIVVVRTDANGNVDGTPGCSPDVTPPVITGCPANISVEAAAPVAVNWTPPTATDNCGTPTLSATHPPGATFQFGTVTVTYTAKDAANNTATCSFNVTVTQQSQPGNYCMPYSNFPWEDWIAGVRIGTQEKTSGKSVYSDFSPTFNFNLFSGSNTVKLTAGFSYFNFEEYWRIWIDFNRDGDFTDPGELVLSAVMPKGPDGSATQSLTQTVNIPAVSLPGTTRMRVVMKRGAYASPCENIPFGEIEDYSVNVATQGGACKKDIGAGEILCISNAPAAGQYYLFAANQGTQTRYTLNREGEVLEQTSAPIVPEDSTLVQGNQVVRKLSNGTIAWQKTITASVLSKFPTIEKAVELNDGTFILGGFQRYYSGGVLTADSLVLIKTDAALNYLSYVRVEHYSGDLKDDKLLGLEKTQSGKVLAIYQTSYTFYAKTYYLRLSQFSPQLQVLKTWATDYVGNLIWKRTPCGLHLFKYGYYNVGPKSQSGGTFSFLFDLETLTFKTNRNSETGSVSYTGSYSRESYTSALFADSISAYYFIAPNVMHLEPFSVRLFRPNGTYFEKRPALIEFDHIFKTGDTTMLFVGSTNGQLWALNPDCGSPGTKQPDLSMANLTLQSTTTSPGAVLWFNFDLKNTGNAPATGEYVIAAYLSTDNQLSADDRVTGYINTGNTPVGTIPGVLGGITVPAEQPAGTYYLILKVDITGTILELNENNNLLVAANAFNVAAGTAETCGFQTSISSDGFSTYGAASINGHHVFRMSRYDEGSNTTLLRNNTLDNNGVVTSTENFSLPEKVTALADENFLCATTADPNVIYLKKLNKAGTALWVKQFFVLNAISVGEVSIIEAVNGDILLTGVFVESWYPTYLHKVFYIRADYNGNLIYRNDFAVTPNDEPYLTARFFTGYNQSVYIVVEKPSYIGQKKPYLLKIAGQSNSLLWQKEFYDFTQIRGIAETSSDATLVTTFHPGAPGGAPNSYGNLYKIDASGNEVFNKNIALLAPAIPPGASYGPVGDVGPIMRGTDGGYITGFTRFFPYTQVPSQSIVIRMNSSLDTLWTRIFNSPDNGLFKTFRAVPGGAFLGTRELTGGPQVNLLKISANGQVSPCAPPASYCQSQSNFPWEDWIARVQVSTLDNSSGKSPYSDFTALYTTLQKDLDYDITLNTGFSYFTWPEYWNVWIDYNHDGVFTEPGELAFSKILSAPAAGTPLASVSGTFKLPASALTGPTRMRITMKRNGDPTPCENLAFGEIEDYTVNIVNNFGGSTGDRAANLSFEAVRNKTWVQLNGLFHSTEAVAEVIMEKSPDGISYEILESEPGQLQPDAVESMRVLDKSPLDGFNFYRMQILLENGTVLYSPVRIVSFDMPIDFTIFPNPASAGIFIQLEEPPTAEMTWTVYDAFGRPVWSQDIQPGTAFPYWINAQSFESGLYYLYVQRKGARAVGRRFVVVK